MHAVQQLQQLQRVFGVQRYDFRVWRREPDDHQPVDGRVLDEFLLIPLGLATQGGRKVPLCFYLRKSCTRAFDGFNDPSQAKPHPAAAVGAGGIR